MAVEEEFLPCLQAVVLFENTVKPPRKNIDAFILAFCKNCNAFIQLDETKYHHNCVRFCLICRDYLSSENYRNHPCFHLKPMQRLANENRVFCRFCKGIYFSKMYLINHEKQCYASQDKAGVLYCKCCSIKFPSIHDLDNHYKLLVDNQGSKNTLECLFCGIKLESDDSFMYHVKHHHLKKFELPETFQSKGDRASTQIPCRFCPLTFKNKNWVISHERKQHSSEVIKCDICLEDVKMENAKSHYVSHRLQERYKNTPDKVCNICGVKIKNLDSHMVRHEDHRKHKCELCTKSFKLHWDLKRHLLVHSNEARHICQVCGKGFKVGYNLRVHMRSHENIKPFPCLICQKTFTTKQWRDNHLKTHG